MTLHQQRDCSDGGRTIGTHHLLGDLTFQCTRLIEKSKNPHTDERDGKQMKTEAFSCCHFRRCRQRSNRPSWCQPFVHCCQVRPGPVFFSNGSLYPLAEISGNLEVSSKSFFGIVSSCFGSKTCLKSTAEKNRKSLPMPARSVSCPLHSQRKIDNPFLS